MKTRLIGVDIGSEDVKLAVWRGSAFRLASEKLPENLIKNDLVVSPELLARFIQQMRKKHRIGGGACAVILPEYAKFFRRMTIPAISAEQLALNLPYEFRDYTANENVKYFYDYAVEKIQYDESNKPISFEILAAAAQVSVVRQYSSLLRRAGLRMVTALPREMAIINLLRHSTRANGREKHEYCIVDIGYEYTRMYIFSGATLKAYKVIDMGCQSIDRAIAEQFDIDKYLAASYRHTNHEHVLGQKPCMDIYERLSLEIRKAINFYNYGEIESNLSDIYFAGEGSDISELKSVISADIGYVLHSISEILPKHDAEETQAARCMAAIGVVL